MATESEITTSRYLRAFRSGKTFQAFLDAAGTNREMWHGMAARTPSNPEAVEAIEASGVPWYVLVLADDWCGDAVNSLPFAASVLDQARNVELRIVPRDRFPEIMDRHMTRGARSIPVALFLDVDGTVAGTWGPRPKPLQDLFEAELRSLSPSERYRELRRWYARDRGRTTVAGFVDGIAAATEVRAEAAGAVRTPCQERRAA